MDTKQCPECLSDCPAAANKCASCGSRFPSYTRQVMWGAAILLVIFLGFMVVKSIHDRQAEDSYNKTRTELCRSTGLNCP